jgi:hypothetical protein
VGWNVNDLTARTHGPLATFGVSGYVFAMDASQHAVFQGFSRRPAVTATSTSCSGIPAVGISTT